MWQRLATIFVICWPLNVLATELTFEEVWRTVTAGSKTQQALQLELQAVKVTKNRATHHWLPQINLDAKTYATNDPGTSFFGTLSQRAVTTQDFVPDDLNYPGNHIYTRGAINLDYPSMKAEKKLLKLKCKIIYSPVKAEKFVMWQLHTMQKLQEYMALFVD